MSITTVQWNIGGGKIRSTDDTTSGARYELDGIDHIVSTLQSVNPDIITLQEVHRNESADQAKELASKLGLRHYVSDFYADSHVEKGQKLGQAIISRYPISKKNFALYINPHYKILWEDGSMAISHDKGVTSVEIDIDGKAVQTTTTHLVPFRRFSVDPLSNGASAVIRDIEAKLQTPGRRGLIQGDFNLNFDSLRPVLPAIFTDNLEEVIQTAPTTPKGRRYDHVLFRGLTLVSSSVDDTVLTDHFPVVSTFDLL